MKSITVFCGSSTGTDQIYISKAHDLGEILAQQNITLIYGGAKVGLMGAVADGVIANGGEAIGVLPHFLGSKEIAHEGLTELIMVESMHERKMKMNELCEGVITLPGGFGTMEELFEMLTWAQLGLHTKPIALLNTNGYYDPLISLIETMVSKGFLKEIIQDMLLVSDNILELLNQMRTYIAPEVPKWINSTTV
jgi:uncharacterized protein (TIGR00730 family)